MRSGWFEQDGCGCNSMDDGSMKDAGCYSNVRVITVAQVPLVEVPGIEPGAAASGTGDSSCVGHMGPRFGASHSAGVPSPPEQQSSARKKTLVRRGVISGSIVKGNDYRTMY